ncbi:MAG: hypothetical protein JST53_14405 [Actinobacteria bacterium]|nr:hypothetical protein [Actinomycetota bacterium]
MTKRRFLGTGALLALSTSLAALVFAGSAAAIAPVQITLKEPEKGSTFSFIDNAPTAKKVHGFPTTISPGDEIVITNPLLENGKNVGKLRARCTATSAASTSSHDAFAAAHFICEGVFTIHGSSLYGNATIGKGGTRGVITGGTGEFANARGTFTSKEEKSGSTTIISLGGE